MNIKALFFFAFLVVACSTAVTEACDGHDSRCTGANGSRGSCCGGMHCQKNDPSWAYGRCYYNRGSG